MIRTETRTARKARHCSTGTRHCTGEIKPGERYLMHVASPGGDLGLLGWSRIAECAGCAETYGRPVEAAPEPQTCQQCGRDSVRGFHQSPAEDAMFNGAVAVPAMSIVECANKTACRKRWPKPVEDDE